MKISSGILLYQWENNELLTLIAFPAGFGSKNVYSIVKGGVEKIIDSNGIERDETPEETARRETFEEVGIKVTKELKYLGEIIYQSKRKKVHCFACEYDGESIILNEELASAEFFQADEAKKLLHRDQAIFVDRLREYLYEQ